MTVTAQATACNSASRPASALLVDRPRALPPGIHRALYAYKEAGCGRVTLDCPDRFG
eukprot:COSAG06_NODE_41596_length_389_cov_2.131034_1_plen_56_part_10